MRRSLFGWMLGIVLMVWLFILILQVRGTAPDGSLILLFGFGIASVALGWLFFGRHTAIIVGAGFLTIPSWFGSVRIPVAVIQSARVVRIGIDTFLEVCLHEVPDTLQPYLNTFTKRRMIAALKRISSVPRKSPIFSSR